MKNDTLQRLAERTAEERDHLRAVNAALLAALEAFAEAFGPVKRSDLPGGIGTYLHPAGVMIRAEIAAQARAAIEQCKGAQHG